MKFLNSLTFELKIFFLTKLYLYPDIKIISLSDGAGSCKHSDLGAEIATMVCAEYISGNFHDIYNDLDNEKVGKVTSAIYSPRLKKNIALAMVDINYSKIGLKLKVEIE